MGNVARVLPKMLATCLCLSFAAGVGALAAEDAASARETTGAASGATPTTSSATEYAPDTIIVTLQEGVSEGQAASLMQARGLGACQVIFSNPLILEVSVGNSCSAEEAVRQLGGCPEVASAELNYRKTADGYTNDADIAPGKYSSNVDKYHYLYRLGVAGPGTTAWDFVTGKKVKVCVVDSGANVTHRDLAANVVAGYNGITDEEGIDKVTDTFGHGTACAGVIGAVGNNQFLSAGVAYDAELYIAKDSVDSETPWYVADTIKCYQWAQEQGCRVLSYSGSSTSLLQAERAAIAAIVAENRMLVVASGGNSGTNEYRYPSSYDGVLSVSALSYSAKTGYTIRPQSTYNNHIGVAAPGTNLYTLSNTGNGTRTFGATSAATAYVAGVAALVFEADPTLSASQCASIITSTALDAGAAGYDEHYGYGIIQPLAAVWKAKGGTGDLSRVFTGFSLSYTKTYGAAAFNLNAHTNGLGNITYRSSNTGVATVNANGKVRLVGPGVATITLSAPKVGIIKAGSKKITVKVKPKAPTKLKAKSTKAKRATVSWKKSKGASGYQVQIAAKRGFAGASTYKVSGKKAKKVIKRLKRGKTHYVRMRAYTNSSGTKLYSAWTTPKKVTVR